MPNIIYFFFKLYKEHSKFLQYSKSKFHQNQMIIKEKHMSKAQLRYNHNCKQQPMLNIDWKVIHEDNTIRYHCASR